MLDKQKDHDMQEIKEAKAAPEVQRSGVIGDTGNQARWNRAQQAHYLGQDESATDLFRKPGDATKSTGKFVIDGLEEESPKIAYDLKDMQKDARKVGNYIEYSKQTLSSFEAPAKLELLNAVYPREPRRNQLRNLQLGQGKAKKIEPRRSQLDYQHKHL